jgi:hypothetical protein
MAELVSALSGIILQKYVLFGQLQSDFVFYNTNSHLSNCVQENDWITFLEK